MANEDKKRALDAAIAKLERIIKPGPCTGARRSSKGAYRRDLRTRVKW